MATLGRENEGEITMLMLDSKCCVRNKCLVVLMDMISLELALDSKVDTLCNSQVSFWFLCCCITLTAQRNVNADLTRHCSVELMYAEM